MSNDAESFAELRREMVARQLRRRQIDDERVLAVMGRVPRELFVSEDLREFAYDDSALAIGHGQTISQPFTVAWMLSALNLRGPEKVLEIGAGSGYGAAVLSQLAREIHTMERIPELAAECRDKLARCGITNVTVHVGDGTTGLPQHAPYDAIIVTAGAPELPAPYVEQLTPGGRIVIPIGTSLGHQTMRRFTRVGDGLRDEQLGSFAFVPLVGKFGWREEE